MRVVLSLAVALLMPQQALSPADERSSELPMFIQENGVGTAQAGAVPLNASNWPVTVEAAAADIIRRLTARDIATLRATAEGDLILFHHGWGTSIRNRYGLWRGNKELLEDACGIGCHPDDASGVIMKAVWMQVRSGTDDQRGGSDGS